MGDVQSFLPGAPRSCSTSTATEPKVFMAKFVRGASLPAAFGSQRTPELLQELRAWMDRRALATGLDAGAGAVWPRGSGGV